MIKINWGIGEMLRFASLFDTASSYVHIWAKGKGFWDEERNDGEMIALCHSELSELLEGLRHDNPRSEHIPNFYSSEEEVADLIIRLMDLSSAKGWRIGKAIIAKMKFNETRP